MNLNPTAAVPLPAAPVALGSTLAPREPQSIAPAHQINEPIYQSRILIVDDEPLNIKITRRYLRDAGYHNFLDTSDSIEALPIMRRERLDLVLLDIMMPGLSGLDVLAELRDDASLSHLPVLILTASDDRATKLKALECGATDFIAKPVDASELVPRVRNCLLAKAYQDQLRQNAQQLERQVLERTAQLESSRRSVIYCLARAAEFRDDDTGRHVLRVGRYAGTIAEQLGWSGADVAMLEQAAQLHDVGKMGIPDEILLKPGKLTPEDFELVQKHCGFGKKIFEALSGDELGQIRRHAELGSRIVGDTGSPLLDMAARIALTHHERWDGSGYPLGLAGADIPLEGRITSVADVFDALSTKRSYKLAFPLDRCFAILRESRGTHFDPAVLDAFFGAREAILQTQIRFAEVE